MIFENKERVNLWKVMLGFEMEILLYLWVSSICLLKLQTNTTLNQQTMI